MAKMIQRGGRRAFTLIELLVSMALTVFVMVILTEAFTKGLDTFSGLKSIGDLQENLRVATSNLRADLAEDHFDAKRRPSDPDLWTNRPRNGFVSITALPIPAASIEGAPDGIQVGRAGNHILHMVVKRKGNRPENFFTSPVPTPGSPLLVEKTTLFDHLPDATLRDPSFPVYNSQWAEVVYFMVPKGTTENAAAAVGAPGVATYNLYRLELVVVPEPSRLNTSNRISASSPGYEKMCCYPDPASPGSFYFPSPEDLLTQGKRGFNLARFPLATYEAKATLVMGDVISFEVKALHHWPSGNSDAAYFDYPTGGVFDSGAPGGYLYGGTPAVIKSLSITIRGWDRGYGRARQVTVVQDL